MKVQITRLKPNAVLPEYQTAGAAAMDLHACIDEPTELGPLERIVIPTGFALALPRGYEAQIRARSGMVAKHGISVANSPGTIDSDYRGDVGVILVNLSNQPFVIEPGMRVAQMIIAKYETAEWQEVEALDETERGKGAYGSTGR